MKEEGTQAKAVSMKQQGSWTQWDSISGRTLSWKDIWNVEVHQLKSLLSSVYDNGVLLTAAELQSWKLTDDPFCAR